MASELWERFSRLPLSEQEKGEIYAEMCNLEEKELKILLPSFLSDEAVVASLRQKFSGHKRQVGDMSFLAAATTEAASKRLKVIQEYRPVYVDADEIVGHVDPVLVALRWLFLLVDGGSQVHLSDLQAARRKSHENKKFNVREELYYPSVLAFLSSASCGQAGLRYGGQGYGNVRRPDIQGFVHGVERAPTQVKPRVRQANDTDPTGVNLNAEVIGQEADYLRATLNTSGAVAAIGCIFCRMDRFWIVRYQQTGNVQVTPMFPPAQKPCETPQMMVASDPRFILMNMRKVDEEASCESTRLLDVLPLKPTGGFATLVAYVGEIQRLFNLPPSLVKFNGADIELSDLKIVAYGYKSLLLLRRSTGTVLKVCMSSSADTEKRVHLATDGHRNLRRLCSWGRVDVGCSEGVFSYLELEGYGEPFGEVHVKDKVLMGEMWEQAYAGLVHLHSKGVLHRDIKPDNMLVFNGVLKINDYDVSCFQGDLAVYTNEVGTRGFQSPSFRPYSQADDVLSLGLAFYYAKTGVRGLTRDERLHILTSELHPDVFPNAMISSVQAALTTLSDDDENEFSE